MCGFIFGSVFWSINIFAILLPPACLHGYSAFISWPRQHIKKAKTSLCQQRSVYQSYGFSSNHVQSELDHKESWALKNWWFQIVMLEKTLEGPLDCKEIQLVSPKGNQPWILIGRTDAEAETPILCPPDAKSWLIEKDPDAGKDWKQEEKEATKDYMFE